MIFTPSRKTRPKMGIKNCDFTHPQKTRIPNSPKNAKMFQNRASGLAAKQKSQKSAIKNCSFYPLQ